MANEIKVTDVGEAQARAEEQVLALASAMEACSECRGQRTVGASPEEAEYCGNCGGSGSVPRFQELRDYYSSQCGKPGCSCAMDWLPLPVAEAAGKLMDLPEFDGVIQNRADGYYRAWFVGVQGHEAPKEKDWSHAVVAAAAAWAGVE